jgi:hypothetical protein
MVIITGGARPITVIIPAKFLAWAKISPRNFLADTLIITLQEHYLENYPFYYS